MNPAHHRQPSYLKPYNETMAKPKNKATRTYVCQGRLNRGAKPHKHLEADRHTSPRSLNRHPGTPQEPNPQNAG